MPADTPAVTAAAAAAASDPVQSMLAETAELLTVDLLQPVVLAQIAAILAAIAVSAFVTRPLRRKLDALVRGIPEKGFRNHARAGVLIVLRNISFSIGAALLLSLLTIGIEHLPLEGAQAGGLVFTRLAYSVFYAWAALLILIAFLSATLGTKLLSPGTQRVVKILFWCFAALQILGILPEIVKVLHEISVPLGKSSVSLWDAVAATFTVFLTVCAANWLANEAEEAIMEARGIEVNLRVVFARISRVVLLALAVLIALSACGIDLTVLSVFGGALGVGLGFGMQKIASNYISGFIILIDRSVKIGDLVEVGGFSGVITQINTRYSVIKNTVGEELIVPNENFVTQSVKNYSLSDRLSVSGAEICISTKSDPDLAMKLLLESALAQKRVLASPSPYCTVTSVAAGCVNLKVSYWMSDPELGTAVLRTHVILEAMRRFAEHGIDIPYPQQSVHLDGAISVRKES